ncbi:MAG TPA: 23S rRNA (adenine(2030)-N(6))-methyltransferase RlmJ [Hyphomicrobium sp.]|nr:23S rRNA (adenine(2030)-N(6))-methyltransferase RlmJ [Hyphomicrobium sp.]
MNYRHSYHAGNFADVLKHIILARVILYLKQKPQPFRVIDTHAGAGRYDLTGLEAGKTGEWHDGIGRLVGAELPTDAATLIAPYLDAVHSLNADGQLTLYPGSPLIARHLMRDGDTLVANELHAEDATLLAAELKRAVSSKVMTLDAWIAIKALLPPPERRGIILIDPPFEKPDEFDRITEALTNGLQRFANGVYIIWYPLKDAAAANRMVEDVAALGCSKHLDVRLKIAAPFAGLGLTETGVLVLNPPYRLRAELQLILPALVACLAQDRFADFHLREPST